MYSTVQVTIVFIHISSFPDVLFCRDVSFASLVSPTKEDYLAIRSAVLAVRV